MKKVFLIIAVASFLASCNSGNQGQLVGARGKKWHPVKPYGMTEVPGGSFIMGKSDDDIAGLDNAPTKTVTVNSFYMDETEITNAEYRQFVQWVRDSIVRQKLAEAAELGGGGGAQGNNGGKSGSIDDYAFKGANQNGGRRNNGTGQTTETPYQQYSIHYDPTNQRLNWDPEILWATADYPDQYYVEVMDEIYLPPSQSYNGQRLMDVTKFVYSYKTMDIEAAARDKGNREKYIQEEKVPVYPDTTVWIKDFNYSYNEPMHNDYFWHAAYDDYPVVGVTWTQAKAFCDWRTQFHNGYRKSKGLHNVNTYRLPSEAEWEYAARGGLESATYPWGGPYAKNDRGCFLANFKPLRGDYAADQSLYTVEADSYEPNDYNLYNMAGNVSEWVNSSYDPSSYEFYSSMNPTVNDPKNRRKVVRGGSWKDVSYFLQVSSRDYEYQDSARSYIGFRTVQDYLGEDIDLNQPPR
ncbi:MULTISPECIES: T9SS ring complex lipoprotein PorK/GldK [Mesonia]|uniref:Serine/threonine-protein kinase pkn1 n=1 Tax=Mesonia oceanica TaxID=2687242 RepID=A0AC61YA82_9FLAO|nr:MULTISPECIES: gliding motility lipoprotein GldK [Mesonia]MAN27369.1 gliding motility lipoprotein GldK [Mesonia sp.]MAQ40355.1 gliding motility lipoprotein GldK [Mesonia sp.]MBJ97266.1 gliding motility lipoprotein GldK [Flavobacteriaceae bacterium]VVV00788.1 Serine/threonine-protein kinase pkn1 [Mesonia oceanica]|tara:strand:- start:4894 stop:6288 length:1395 start_codon:yes stop_codon:yes gene_type:complete